MECIWVPYNQPTPLKLITTPPLHQIEHIQSRLKIWKISVSQFGLRVFINSALCIVFFTLQNSPQSRKVTSKFGKLKLSQTRIVKYSPYKLAWGE